MVCGECLFSDAVKTGSFKVYETYAPINETGIYVIDCPIGHKRPTILQGQRFELLFELAFYAIADGYYREAVASFASSLERFYEFYLRVLSIKNGISPEQFDEVWKALKLSERQLGAFVIAYLLENKTAPNILPQRKVEFRNDVIHKGKVPSKEEAIDFGKTILDLIFPVHNEITIKYDDFVKELMRRQTNDAKEKIKKTQLNEKSAEIKPVQSHISFLMNSLQTKDEKPDFDIHLKWIQIKVAETRQFPNGYWIVRGAEKETIKYIPV